MESFPDVLTISYRDLGKTPSERLRLVAVLGALLHRSPSYYTPQALGLTPQDWILLHDWVTKNSDSEFIVAHSQGVTLRRDTNDHVLVGIDLLMSDLHGFLQTNSAQSSVAGLWGAVKRLVDREVAQ